eukprot:Transcript_9505.p2 GENE.Transcript_9505~~Transcript_9505.p2  ORF type:complete len:302 (+),score=38.89 Transcript_9505:820-1725(+)
MTWPTLPQSAEAMHALVGMLRARTRDAVQLSLLQLGGVLAASLASELQEPVLDVTAPSPLILGPGFLSPKGLSALLTPTGSGFHVDFNAALEAMQQGLQEQQQQQQVFTEGEVARVPPPRQRSPRRTAAAAASSAGTAGSEEAAEEEDPLLLALHPANGGLPSPLRQKRVPEWLRTRAEANPLLTRSEPYRQAACPPLLPPPRRPPSSRVAVAASARRRSRAPTPSRRIMILPPPPAAARASRRAKRSQLMSARRVATACWEQGARCRWHPVSRVPAPLSRRDLPLISTQLAMVPQGEISP